MFKVVAAAIIGAILITIGCTAYLYFGRLWMRTHIAHASIPFMAIVGIAVRGGSPLKVINAFLEAHKAGISVELAGLEAHHKAGGNIKDVVRGMISAHRDERDVTFEDVCAMDMDGKDILKEVGPPILKFKEHTTTSE